ncbi:hypothetical protein [Desulfitobacterium sp. AusDCA]|uniref:hypothetical protein n=1 Tax=Desulfitobacterium sp. AusDCA TaxID=3240383 RepID=UPI003DA6E0B8
MEKIRVVKIYFLSLFKPLIIIGGIGGIIVGLIVALFFTPTSYTQNTNGNLVRSIMPPNILFSELLRIILETFFTGISIAIGILLLLFLINFVLKRIGGIIIYIEKDIL